MRLLLIFILAACLVLMISCKKSGEDTPAASTPTLKTDDTTVNLSSARGSIDSFTIQSNLDWTLTVSPATATWLKVAATSGNGNSKVIVTAQEPNTGTSARTAILTLSPMGNTAVQPVSITVNQKAINFSLLWSKVFGGTLEDIPQAMAKAADGGFLMVGTTRSTNWDVTMQQGNGDAWLVRTDAAGNKLWQKTYGGSGSDNANAVIASPGGGYVIAGTTGSSDGDITGYRSGLDGWVLKVDAAGNKLWSKAFGGTFADFILAVAATPDGGYVLTGYSYSNDGDATGHHGSTGSADAWVLKIDGNGNKLWQKSLGGSIIEVAHSVVATADGGCIFGGLTGSNDGDVTGNHATTNSPLDAWVVKLDGSGNMLWQKTFGGTAGEVCYSIVPTADGNYVLAGFTTSNDGDMNGLHGNGATTDAWLMKMDGSGGKMWLKLYGGSGNESFRTAVPVPDGGYIIFGAAASNDGDVSGLHSAENDAWVVKADATGSLQWQKAMGGSGIEYGYSVFPLTDGSFAMFGSSQSNDGDISGALGSIDFWLSKIKVE